MYLPAILENYYRPNNQPTLMTGHREVMLPIRVYSLRHEQRQYTQLVLVNSLGKADQLEIQSFKQLILEHSLWIKK